MLAAEPSQILDEIHGKTFEEEGKAIRLLTDDEYFKLKIPKGSLDDKERQQINSHVTHTFKFLSTIPWTKEMRNIPDHRLWPPREAGRQRVSPGDSR